MTETHTPSAATPGPFQDVAGAELAGADLPALDTTPLHEATTLTEGGKVARIHLNGQVYALRITRQGKLILTK